MAQRERERIDSIRRKQDLDRTTTRNNGLISGNNSRFDIVQRLEFCSLLDQTKHSEIASKRSIITTIINTIPAARLHLQSCRKLVVRLLARNASLVSIINEIPCVYAIELIVNIKSLEMI